MNPAQERLLMYLRSYVGFDKIQDLVLICSNGSGQMHSTRIGDACMAVGMMEFEKLRIEKEVMQCQNLGQLHPIK